MKRYMIVDVDRCWGCKSCTVACKMMSGIPVGCASRVSVFRIETLGADGEARCDFIPVFCQHCEEPQCVANCPRNALYINEEGLVLLDSSLCIGCGKCERVCPYGAITFYKNEEGRKVFSKCDTCIDRRSRGGKTFCEQHCPGQVFSCVDEAEADSLVHLRRYHFSVGHVVYVSDVLENLGFTQEANEE